MSVLASISSDAINNDVLLVFSVLLFLQSAAECSRGGGGGGGRNDRWTIRANDVLDLAEKTRVGFDDFRETLEYGYHGTGYRSEPQPRSVGDRVREVTQTLGRMIGRSVEASRSYVVQRVYAYVRLANRVIDENGRRRLLSEGGARDTIGFGDDLPYCSVAALYDAGVIADWLAECLVSVRTVYANASYSLRDVACQLRECRERIVRSGVLFEPLREPPRDATLAQLERALTRVKRDIARFASAFCARHTPFVGDYFDSAAKTAAADRDRIFVHHVLHSEICVIHFDRILHEVESQQNIITTWCCDNVLKSQEYRFEKYKEDVTVQSRIKQTSTNKVESGEFEFRPPNPHPRIVPIKGENELSLAKLRDVLKSNNHYVNVVKYDYIASRVLVLVSIREGSKIIKGIKHVVTSGCRKIGGGKMRRKSSWALEAIRAVVFRRNRSKTRRITDRFFDDVHRLRSILAAFKSVFDNLVLVFFKQTRISYADDAHKTSFDTAVNSLLNLLQVRDVVVWSWKTMWRICDEIQGSVSEVVHDDAYLGDNPDGGGVKFEQYYFTEPILNVSQLYRFAENGF